MFHIDHRLITAYHPRADGLVERVNKEVGRALKKFMCEAQGMWPTWVPIAQMGLNDHVSSRTQTRPAALMFNRSFNNFFDFSNTDFQVVQESVQERLNKWKEYQDVVVPGIATRTQGVKGEMTQRLDSKTRIVKPLAPGTVVWALDHTRKSKWDPVREGPFTVVRQTEGGSYELKDRTNTILPTKRAIEMLTVQEEVEPEDDLQSYEVEKILDHKERPQGFEYFVKWKNCPESDNSG